MLILPHTMIADYIRVLTCGRAGATPDPPTAIDALDADIRTLRRRAHRAGDLPWLRAAFFSLIADPDGRIDAFVGPQYPYSDAEMVALLRRAYATLWPAHALPADDDRWPIHIDTTPREDPRAAWDALKAEQQDWLTRLG